MVRCKTGKKDLSNPSGTKMCFQVGPYEARIDTLPHNHFRSVRRRLGDIKWLDTISGVIAVERGIRCSRRMEDVNDFFSASPSCFVLDSGSEGLDER